MWVLLIFFLCVSFYSIRNFFTTSILSFIFLTNLPTSTFLCPWRTLFLTVENQHSTLALLILFSGDSNNPKVTADHNGTYSKKYCSKYCEWQASVSVKFTLSYIIFFFIVVFFRRQFYVIIECIVSFVIRRLLHLTCHGKHVVSPFIWAVTFFFIEFFVFDVHICCCTRKRPYGVVNGRRYVFVKSAIKNERM